jgi:hypothetical protein
MPPHLRITGVVYITTNILPNGETNRVYNQTLTADGTPTITWTIESGNLPNGLNLSSNGVISGTATAKGTFTFTVKAANSSSSDTRALSITVTDKLFITTDSLPNGEVGKPYSDTLTANSAAAITWTLESGNMPSGLNLYSNGVISGTPTAKGIFTFTVKAANSNNLSNSDTKALSITINDGTRVIELQGNEDVTLRVYPNPVNDKLQITNYDSGEIQISNIMGQILLSLPSYETAINVSHLPAGIYFLKVGDKTMKFVKE